MDSIRYAEELVREFLLFRGFSNTLRSFEADLAADFGHGFQVDRILDLFFSLYIPRFQADKLVGLLAFLKQTFFSPHDARYESTIRKLETSLKRYYIVHALQKGRADRVLEFFEHYGASLLLSGDDWNAWFAIPYMKNPSMDPQFQVYFSREWLDTLVVSLRNFLSEIFDSIRLPALVKVSSELTNQKVLQHELEQLHGECSRLQTSLLVKDEEIAVLKRGLLKATSQHLELGKSGENSSMVQVDELAQSKNVTGTFAGTGAEIVVGSSVCRTASFCAVHENPYSQDSKQKLPSMVIEHQQERIEDNSVMNMKVPSREATFLETESADGTGRTCFEDDYIEVAVDTQETFSGHTSPISKCRFSAGGNNIASASIDGTVRIWTCDLAASNLRNATIYCGAEIMSLEWDYKSDRLLLIGTAERGIKAWNADSKRVVCDLMTDVAFPRVLDLKCSPVEPVFVSAASSLGHGGDGIEAMGFASLTVWNMKTWKPLTYLPLGEDPPAITSICFNHNGKMLAAAATDGMIHLFDMYASLPITGWPAHDSSVSCVKFGPDQASIFSLGSDGKVFEWSLHNQGQILQQQDASSFCSSNGLKLPQQEMALDAQGRMLLLTSNLTSSPLYQLDSKAGAWRTLKHNGPITSVDWHPTLPVYLTGSSDHSVRVTTLF